MWLLPNRKTITAPDVIRATTSHLRGIGGDSHAADELEEILETELEAFRTIQALAKAAKAQGGASAGGPKRGFPGKAKKEVSVGGEEEEQVEADIAADGDVEGDDGEGEGDGDEAEVEEQEEEEEEEEVDEQEAEVGAAVASEEDTEMQ
ncbi:hypothetical protein QFC24_003820 [Naganishia onofrii]|uniref:Uncharacterized protein n=1 Tax=Naganishia onofrii TaxID=1851511 RepID=A0ACC2XJK6_9TREE|nr:hypothetical protein QFC24_003820 [Naganishia onofrii]